MSEVTHTCRIHEKYNIECANPALPGDPDGLCILHSQDKAKDPAAFRETLRARFEQKDLEYYDLSGIFFSGPFNLVDFLEDREFEKFADFSEAIFIDAAFFPGATFKEGADFFNATFKEWAWFEEATFLELADFGGVSFKKKAFFFKATFKQEANFRGATFAGQAVFTKTTFTELADFTEATFMEAVEFFLSSISGLVVFRDINSAKELKSPPAFRGFFESLQLNAGAVLRFQNLSLSQVFFRDTDLRQAEFHHVQWHPYRGRQAIYDEALLRQAEWEDPWFLAWFCFYAPYADPPSPWGDRYGDVERLYRSLVLNYEEGGDYKASGDFHYGEMEMHRRASKWRWFPFYWYNLYWALSGYGERPSQALGWLAAFLAIFTGLLAWAGLEILDPKYSISFGNPFFYLLQKVTLQRPTWAEPVGFWGNLVAGFSVLLIPGQAALFLLALRNRLGRRR